MKVIITEKLTDQAINHLNHEGFETDVKLNLTHEQLIKIISSYDALIVRSATKVNAELISKATNLKVVGRAGNGIDNIDLDFCTEKGIVVVNTPESNIMAAAELAIGLAFSAFRNIPQAHMAAKNNDFDRNKFKGNELSGKTVGIVGLGRISSIVASRLQGCNMKVVAYDPYVTDEVFKKLNIIKCNNLEELLSQSDLITVHTPKTKETYNMIGEKELSMCKKGVRIVNAARGGIIDEEALYNALRSGQVASAAIDVLDPEPDYTKTPEAQDYKNILLELDNVIITPHIGASTFEAGENVSIAVAKLVASTLKDEMVPAVNMPPIRVSNLDELKPYLHLAESLGKIYYQLQKETVEKIEIIYSGESAEKETGVITLSILKGFLQPTTKEKINYVNATYMIKNMGVKVIESKTTELEKYTTLITVNFITTNNKYSIAGTIFGKAEIRIVDLFGYQFDFAPSSHVIAIKNIDMPGMVGKIGTAFGENNINIASMQLSRNTKGGTAASFVSVDVDFDDNILNSLKNIEGILEVSKLNF